jgi:hypothetical protein
MIGFLFFEALVEFAHWYLILLGIEKTLWSSFFNLLVSNQFNDFLIHILLFFGFLSFPLRFSFFARGIRCIKYY